MARALQGAFAAARAFLIIDACEVVDNVDCVILAGLLAYFTADAADVAYFAENRTFLM